MLKNIALPLLCLSLMFSAAAQASSDNEQPPRKRERVAETDEAEQFLKLQAQHDELVRQVAFYKKTTADLSKALSESNIEKKALVEKNEVLRFAINRSYFNTAPSEEQRNFMRKASNGLASGLNIEYYGE